jgi:hypothetical protein
MSRNIKLVVGGLLIAAGITLLAVPYEVDDLNVVDREHVSLSEMTAMMTTLDVDSIGRYQVWVEDRLPGEEDHPYLVFEIEEGDVPVERGDGSVVENIDGVPHELFCTFRLDGSGYYFYDVWTTDDFRGEVDVELVFTKKSVWMGRPLLWPGIILIVIGITTIGYLLWKEFRAYEGREDAQESD